jgi:anti-repressor protein
MRENGYLIKQRGRDYNSPTQKAMNMGLFRIKENTITHSNGKISINKTPLVTGKGQTYFIKKFFQQMEGLKLKLT